MTLYEKAERTSTKYGEENDCVVKALSIITGQSYERCHIFCQSHGRENLKGVNAYEIFRSAGLKLTPVKTKGFFNSKYINKLRRINKNKRYHITTKTDTDTFHSVAVVNGKTECFSKDQKHPIVFMDECDISNTNLEISTNTNTGEDQGIANLLKGIS